MVPVHDLSLSASIRKKWQMLRLTRGVDNKVHIFSVTITVLKFRTPKCLTKWHMQIVQTQIRLLLKEQSDQDLH